MCTEAATKKKRNINSLNFCHIFCHFMLNKAIILLWGNSWQFFFIIFTFFGFCILIHSYQKSQVLVERERGALKTRLSALVPTVFLVHDKPKIKCFAIFFLWLKLRRKTLPAMFVIESYILQTSRFTRHFSLINHRKWIDLLKRSDVCLRQRCSCGESGICGQV